MFGIDLKEVMIKKLAKKFLPMIPQKGPEAEKEFIKFINSYELREGETSTIAVAYPDKEGRVHVGLMSLNQNNQIVRSLASIKLDDLYQILSDPKIMEDPMVKGLLDKIEL
jgi:hypothetical protein